MFENASLVIAGTAGQPQWLLGFGDVSVLLAVAGCLAVTALCIAYGLLAGKDDKLGGDGEK